MAEPCIIDIKIGKRTWDPLASPEKIRAEEQKYQACKQNLGFCIPGFQVYDIKTGRIKRYGKDYGKKLNQDTVKDGEWHRAPRRLFPNPPPPVNLTLCFFLSHPIGSFQH